METPFGDETMTTITQNTAEGNRIHFLDNLRTFVVFLVILCHAGGVYESSGIWASFWIVDDPSVNNTSGLVNIVLDIFMMPTLFLISGYLAAASLMRRTPWSFVKSKLRRLMIPWIIAALTLIPVYKVIFLYSRNLPQEHWTTYFHWSNGIWNQNWLWFLPALFLFDLLYVLLSSLRIKVPQISLKSGILGALLLGFTYSLVIDQLGLFGWTKTPLLDFQNERLLIYFLTFLVGVLCFKRGAFDAKPKGRFLFYAVNATSWIPITAYVSFLLFPWLKPGQNIVSPVADKLILWSSFHLSLLCLVYTVVETFRRYLNTSERLREQLNRNSYYVYIIHVIVTGGLALLMLEMALPSLVKYAILTVSTFVLSHLVVSVVRLASARTEGRIGASMLVSRRESVGV